MAFIKEYRNLHQNLLTEMKYLLSAIVILNLAFSSILAQDSLLSINGLIGDTIDLREKTEYYLFPDIPDSTYKFSYIKYADSLFILVTYFSGDTLQKRIIDTLEINSYRSNVVKLIKYYEYQNQAYTLDSMIIFSPLEPDPSKITIINSEMIDRLIEEAIHIRRLNYDMEMQYLYDHGQIQYGPEIMDASDLKKK